MMSLTSPLSSSTDQVIAMSVVEDLFGLPVWVPAAPNDGGLAVGGAWQVMAPDLVAANANANAVGGRGASGAIEGGGDADGVSSMRPSQALQYSGPPLFDLEEGRGAPDEEAQLRRLVDDLVGRTRVGLGTDGVSDAGVVAGGSSIEIWEGEATVERVGALLAAGKVLGVARGRTEFGELGSNLGLTNQPMRLS